MLTMSPSSRDVMRSQQMAIARRLISLQSCGSQQQEQAGRFRVQQLGDDAGYRNSVDEEEFPFQVAREAEDDEDLLDDELLEEDEDLEDDDVSIAPPTIEQIKDDYNSCFSCGVSWSENHVSLDCRECGGYALTRPCLACEGRCGAQWSRNLAASHGNRQAQWEGRCANMRVSAPPCPTMPHERRPKTLAKEQPAKAPSAQPPVKAPSATTPSCVAKQSQSNRSANQVVLL